MEISIGSGKLQLSVLNLFKDFSLKYSPGGGGDSDMKWTGMLVVSLRGVNFGFWSRLGCSGQNVIIFSRQGLV